MSEIKGHAFVQAADEGGASKKNLVIRWKINTRMARTTAGIIWATGLIRRAADQTRRRRLCIPTVSATPEPAKINEKV